MAANVQAISVRLHVIAFHADPGETSLLQVALRESGLLWDLAVVQDPAAVRQALTAALQLTGSVQILVLVDTRLSGATEVVDCASALGCSVIGFSEDECQAPAVGRYRQRQPLRSIWDLQELSKDLRALALGADLDEPPSACASYVETQEARYRALVEASSQVVWTCPPSGEQRGPVPGWQTFTGQRDVEVLGMGWLDAVHPDDRRNSKLAWDKAATRKESFEIERRLRRYDGSYRWMRVRAVPRLDRRGEIVEWVGMSTDITEYRAARELLAESERRLRAIFHGTFELMGLLSPTGCWLAVNRAARDFCGKSEAELIGRRFWESASWQVDEKTPALIREAIERASAGEFMRFDVAARRADGEIATIDFSLRPEFDEDGRVVYLVPEGRDVTERVAQEQKTLDRKRLLRLSLAAAQAGSWVWDLDTGRVDWSPEAYALMGFDASVTATYESWISIVHPEDLAGVEEKLRVALEGGPAYVSEYRITLPDGRMRWVQGKGQLQPGGKRMVGLIIDVTAWKEAERAVALRTEELSRSNRELEQFAHTAGHDLQEPLRTIASFTQFLARRGQHQLDEANLEYLGYINDAVVRMQLMLKGLLDYAKVGGEKVQQLKPICMERALEVSLASLAGLLRETGGTVTYGSLPVVYADMDHLTRLFQNLISNALKYRRPDVPMLVSVRAVQTGDEWEVAVEDNGKGFAMKHAERVFQIFKRLHSAEQPGAGIGLALCRRIVERHGGRIWATSTPGQGSVFSFTLPQQPPL